MSEEKKTGCAPQLRLLKVIEILSGNEVFGMRLADIAKAIEVTPPMALRDLQSLERGGWAQQIEDSRWRLAAKPFQLLANLQWGLQNAGARLADVQQRYTRQQ